MVVNLFRWLIVHNLVRANVWLPDCSWNCELWRKSLMWVRNPRALWRLAEDDEMWRRSGEDLWLDPGGRKIVPAPASLTGWIWCFSPLTIPLSFKSFYFKLKMFLLNLVWHQTGWNPLWVPSRAYVAVRRTTFPTGGRLPHSSLLRTFNEREYHVHKSHHDDLRGFPATSRLLFR